MMSPKQKRNFIEVKTHASKIQNHENNKFSLSMAEAKLFQGAEEKNKKLPLAVSDLSTKVRNKIVFFLFYFTFCIFLRVFLCFFYSSFIVDFIVLIISYFILC